MIVAHNIKETAVRVADSSSKTKLISDEERTKRMKAVEYAKASVALEGFRFDEIDEHDLRFINGEISLAEYVAK
ncbi:MAG: antitoxin VbhA family protein [Helicobacteraceae bacterium]|jgi:hypothetical protein|nr:antitoxin VbhA family protein [Helicobacteraceae bacterium]